MQQLYHTICKMQYVLAKNCVWDVWLTKFCAKCVDDLTQSAWQTAKQINLPIAIHNATKVRCKCACDNKKGASQDTPVCLIDLAEGKRPNKADDNVQRADDKCANIGYAVDKDTQTNAQNAFANGHFAGDKHQNSRKEHQTAQELCNDVANGKQNVKHKSDNVEDNHKRQRDNPQK